MSIEQNEEDWLGADVTDWRASRSRLERHRRATGVVVLRRLTGQSVSPTPATPAPARPFARCLALH